MCMREQWRLHCTSQRDTIERACVPCGCHIQNDWGVEQRICNKFYIKLEHSSVETLGMTQKATAMGKWWLAASSRQRPRSCITSHVEFFGESLNHPCESAPSYSPDLAPCNFWLFPKLKSLWKGRDLRPLLRFRKIWWGSWWQLGELCEVPRCLLWRGLRCHCPVYNISYIFFDKCLCFSYDMAGYLLDRPCIDMELILSPGSAACCLKANK